ncbi:NAD-dependent epimerase/dehydratase family protein [Capillimicrobium parvum]|uniref:dTDP-glucose 4,6-dehydratase n=1 Tax=Capillimicrobium parvum TaxID=2884022 RepID=A0A9E7C2M1_9ACTN|nr:NAD(P)-dependent oxidoreductase [Capillimicrobium parvum]UGS38700.1 dTDP-glucose 4,6-dehydratase [Capillimicrobium parvum]
MRILLTGATGLIGREVVRLAPAGWEIVAAARRPVPGLETAEADLAAPGFAAALPVAVDAIVHLAQAREYRDFPACAPGVIAVNVAATAELLDHAARCGAGQFLLASTATVYRPGTTDGPPLREDGPVRCRSIYSSSKRSAELLAGPYAALFGVRALRIFTTYGAVRDERLVSDLIDRVEHGRAVEVQGERGLVTSPIHASDVARAVIAAVQRPPERGELDVVNVGGPQALGIADMARAIGRVLGREPRLEARPGEPPAFAADRGKCVAQLAVPEPVAFEEGLARELVGSRA